MSPSAGVVRTVLPFGDPAVASPRPRAESCRRLAGSRPLLLTLFCLTLGAPWLSSPCQSSPGSGPASHLSPLGPDSLGPAFNIGGEPVYGAAAGMQAPSAIASDGTDYLIVWDDLRDGSWDVYGARVTGDRRLADSSGIAISIRPGDQGHPSLAFDGTCYFVVWEDKRSGRYEIFGTRIGVDGQVFDPLGILIAAAAADLRNPDVAFDGTNYMVVWQDSTCGSYDLHGLRIDREGNVVDSVRVPAWSGPRDQITPRVAFDGTNFLVVWGEGEYESHDILGARVGTDGEAIDSLAIPISTAAGDQTAPDVACGDRTWLVAWRDIRAGFGLDEIYGARVSAEGLVLDGAGIPVSGGSYEAQDPKVSFDGANYLVVWYDWRDELGVRAVRVTSQGSVLDAQAIDVSEGSNGGWAAAVGFNGTDYLVAWKGNSPYDLCGARVAVDGTVVDSLPANFSLAASDQSAAAASFDGTNYLVVWHELRNGGYDICGVRVAPDGSVLDPYGIPVCISPADQEQPAVAFDGENFLVVWQDSRIESYGYPHTIYGARISRDGAVLDPSGIMISTASDYQSFPAVAFDGTNYFVVWQREVLGPYTDLYGARVTKGGIVIDTAGIPISTAPYGQAHADLAFDGSNYLVVWEDMRGGHRNDVYCARVTPAGEVIDGAGIAISTEVWHQSYPDVAFDGTNYFVVWHDQRNGTSFDVYGARVGADGSVLDPGAIPISTDLDDQHNPDVVYDGTCYFVAWRGHRDGFFDVDGARVSTEGVVLDPEGLAISRADQNQLTPGVARGSYRQILVAYASFTPQVYGSYRIWGNLYGDCAGVSGEPGKPDHPILYQVLPNPFVTSTALRFYLPREERITVGIHDVEGRAVSKIADGVWAPGTHQIAWDGRSGDRTAAPGIYFVRLEADGYSAVKKVVRLR